MPGYFHTYTRVYEKCPSEFARMQMISHIRGATSEFARYQAKSFSTNIGTIQKNMPTNF